MSKGDNLGFLKTDSLLVSKYIDASLCCLTKTQNEYIKSSVICVYVGHMCVILFSSHYNTLGQIRRKLQNSPHPMLLISTNLFGQLADLVDLFLIFLSPRFHTMQSLISVRDFLQQHQAGKHWSTHMFTDLSLSCWKQMLLAPCSLTFPFC